MLRIEEGGGGVREQVAGEGDGGAVDGQGALASQIRRSCLLPLRHQ